MNEPPTSVLAALLRDGIPISPDGAPPPRPRDDDDLAAMWAEERDASVLVELLRRIAEPPAFVRAALACGREALALLPDDEARPRDLLRAIEAWLRGEAEEAQIRRATKAAFEAAKETPRRAKGLPPYGPGGVAAVRAVANVGLAVYDPEAQEVVSYAATALADRARGESVDSAAFERERAAALARLADAVRAAVPRPTYEELLSVE